MKAVLTETGMAESITASGRRAGSAVRIGFTIIILLFLSTATIFASEEPEERVYERVIAHGGGAYKGYETTNSVEALNNAISNGYKIIELDMELSADHEIIMLHDWDRTSMHYYGTSFPKKLNRSTFMNLSVHGELEVLTFDKLEAILKKNPGIRIVTDTKGDNPELLTAIADKYPDLVGRIIPQIYDYDEYQTVHDLGYQDIIFTIYKLNEIDAGKLAGFVSENDIYAVTMPDYYVQKGILSTLSGKGIPVYVHPVDTYEKALRLQRQGACGFYSGTLLPEEFEGVEREYFLTVVSDDGSLEKLSDKTFRNGEDIQRAVRIKGLKEGESPKYLIDGAGEFSNLNELSDLDNGKHKLTVQICRRDGKAFGQLDYSIWKNENGIRLLHRKYEYRLDSVKETKEFHQIMEANRVSLEVRSILENSLIARKDESLYYNNAIAGSFRSRDEQLTVQENFYGALLLPLSTTFLELGASSVTMDKGNDIVIDYENQKTRTVVGSYIMRSGFRSTKLTAPVKLYLNKTFASGEIYEKITGRPYIENQDVIVILPQGVASSKGMREELCRAAALLF